jgi:mevalonate kinase
MATLRLSIPGKAFFGGEYLALLGGPALTVAVEPQFELSVEKKAGEGKNPFHPESPAGLLWQRHENYLKDFLLGFCDPHLGAGGFGGSTAEFAVLHSLIQLKESLWVEAQPNFDLHLMLNDYRQTCSYRASGADLVGQVRGGLTFFSRERGQVQTYPWLFSDLGFLLAKTSEKLKTHEHLKDLSSFPTQGFEKAMVLIEESFHGFNSNLFVRGINAYGDELARCGFVTTNTRDILNQLNHTDILAKKGCGAMGADVVMVIYRKGERQAEVLAQVQRAGLQVVAAEASLSSGLRCRTVSRAGREAQL